MTRITSKRPLSSSESMLLVGVDLLPSIYLNVATYRRETSRREIIILQEGQTGSLINADRQKENRKKHLRFLTQQAQELNLGYE